MKKTIALTLISLVIGGVLTSCALFRTHKTDIEQGNIITQEEVSRLHLGMTESQVKAIMGDPVLVNIFTPQRMEYVYTFKQGYGSMLEKRVSCLFQSGRLLAINKTI